MDDKRFDALTRSLAEGTSRRKVLKGLLGGLVGGAAVKLALIRPGAGSAEAARPASSAATSRRVLRAVLFGGFGRRQPLPC